MNTKAFYSQKSVVLSYDKKRFGSVSGEFVNKKELKFFVQNLSKIKGRILDVPFGTGRVGKILNKRDMLYGLDSSKEMMKITQKQNTYSKQRVGDIRKMPFRNNYFEAVVCLRLFHHNPLSEVIIMLKEIRRVLKKGGELYFDTHTRSPKIIASWIFPKHFSKVYLHGKKELLEIMKNLGFQVVETRSSFLFSPLIYRHIPIFFLKKLDKLEVLLPKRLRIRIFWKVKKA